MTCTGPFSRLREKVARERRMRAGAPAPVADTFRNALLTFYSYCAYSPSARPAWGPGRDGGLGWGSSGGPAGRGKRTSGSRERNARPRGHYDPRAARQLAGRHCRFRSALRSAKIPPAAGAVWALSTSHLSSPRWAAPAPPSRALERQTTPEAAGTASSAIRHVPALETIATSPVISTSIRHPGESRDPPTRSDEPRRSPG